MVGWEIKENMGNYDPNTEVVIEQMTRNYGYTRKEIEHDLHLPTDKIYKDGEKCTCGGVIGKLYPLDRRLLIWVGYCEECRELCYIVQ
jgi:hypothetical protein